MTIEERLLVYAVVLLVVVVLGTAALTLWTGWLSPGAAGLVAVVLLGAADVAWDFAPWHPATTVRTTRTPLA